MKQIDLTPKLIELIKERVGPDTATDGLAVFEAIALNTKPLPGKDGTLHERAVVSPLTLRQMADSIRNGNHLPLISDHQLMGEPKGRIFDADLNYADDGELELRVLFFLDPTEDRLIAKLNAASLDEVSVSFMPTEFLCSECGWDYFGPGMSWDNLMDRTCGNGHEIGTDGVHANLVGLSEFIEVSLVARGAADTPKIVGKSQSKLAPATLMRLAAAGNYDTNGLIVRASKGVETVSNPDFTQLVKDLTNAKVDLSAKTTELTAAQTQLTTANTRVTELETSLAAVEAERDELKTADHSEGAAALTFVTETYTKLAAAANKEGDAPATVAELVAGINEMTSDLTSIIPVGGKSKSASDDDTPKTTPSFDAFTVRKN